MVVTSFVVVVVVVCRVAPNPVVMAARRGLLSLFFLSFFLFLFVPLQFIQTDRQTDSEKKYLAIPDISLGHHMHQEKKGKGEKRRKGTCGGGKRGEKRKRNVRRET